MHSPLVGAAAARASAVDHDLAVAQRDRATVEEAAGAEAVVDAWHSGERRSLAIVRVEGRRLLIGLTPGAISLLADLAPAPEPPAAGSMERAS